MRIFLAIVGMLLIASMAIGGEGLASNPFPKQITLHPVDGTRDSSLMHAGGRVVHKSVTLAGNGGQTDNLFTVTGPNRVLSILLVVTEATDSTTLSNVKFETDDGAAQDDITGTVNMSGCVAGAIAYRKAVSGTALAYLNAAAGGIDEAATNKVNFEFNIVQKTGGVATYIRLSYTGDATTDVDVDVHVRYQPEADESNIEPV